MSKLHDAIRNGTVEEIAEAVFNDDCTAGYHRGAMEIAEAIVAAREPEDTVRGTAVAVRNAWPVIMTVECDQRQLRPGGRNPI